MKNTFKLKRKTDLGSIIWCFDKAFVWMDWAENQRNLEFTCLPQQDWLWRLEGQSWDGGLCFVLYLLLLWIILHHFKCFQAERNDDSSHCKAPECVRDAIAWGTAQVTGVPAQLPSLHPARGKMECAGRCGEPGRRKVILTWLHLCSLWLIWEDY